MRLILNIIWLVLCGFWMAIAYVITGIIACVLLALAFDAVIVLGTRVLTPWLRVQGARA